MSETQFLNIVFYIRTSLASLCPLIRSQENTQSCIQFSYENSKQAVKMEELINEDAIFEMRVRNV